MKEQFNFFLQSLMTMAMLTANTQKHRWAKINLPRQPPPNLWCSCLKEGFIMIWLMLPFKSTGSNISMAVKTWVKLPIQCKGVDHTFFYTNMKPIQHCMLFFSIYLIFSLKRWTYKLHKKLSQVKQSICYKYHWVYQYCDGFCVNFHKRMRGNWCIFLLFLINMALCLKDQLIPATGN